MVYNSDRSIYPCGGNCFGGILLSMDRINMASRDYKSNLKNLSGTFEVENMKLSDECILNLEQLARGDCYEKNFNNFANYVIYEFMCQRNSRSNRL